VIPLNHLRNRIDDLGWRIEQTHDADEARRIAQECSELERAIQLHEDHLKREVADMEAAKLKLHRLRARL
jgi:hypothetical protein